MRINREVTLPMIHNGKKKNRDQGQQSKSLERQTNLTLCRYIYVLSTDDIHIGRFG